MMSVHEKIFLAAIAHCSGNASLPEALHGQLFCEAPLESSLFVSALAGCAFVLLISAALVGNGVVLWIIYKHKVMHNGFNLILCNLAVADCSIALLNIGTSWPYNVSYDWWFGEFCRVNWFFGIAPTTVSVFSMMALSWDRCEAVVNPLRKRPLSRRRSLLLITLIWLIATATALPSAINAKVERLWFFDRSQLHVRHTCESPHSIMDKAWFVLQYALPLFVLALTFLRIWWALRRTDSATDKHTSAQLRAKNKAVRMLALMVIAFMLSWLPYHLYHTFEISEFIENRLVYLVIYFGAMSSTAVNPFIYCYSNVRFRTGFRYVFRWAPFVHCGEDQYAFSPLFPEKARSKAISMDRNKYSLASREKIPQEGGGREHLCGSAMSDRSLLNSAM